MRAGDGDRRGRRRAGARGSDRARARAADCGAARPGGGRLPADGDDGQPDRARDPRAARHRARRRGARAHHGRRARRRRVPLRPADARPPRPPGAADARAGSRAAWSPTASFWTPRASVLALENTHNTAGGTVWPLDELHAVVDTGRELGLRVHLDGARLMNAAVAIGVPPCGDRRPVRHGHDLPLEGARLPARRADRRLARADASARGSRSTASAARCARPASSPRPGSTRSTTTSSGSPTTTPARAGSPRAWAAAGLPVDLELVQTNFVQLDVAALGLDEDEARRRGSASRECCSRGRGRACCGP